MKEPISINYIFITIHFFFKPHELSKYNTILIKVSINLRPPQSDLIPSIKNPSKTRSDTRKLREEFNKATLASPNKLRRYGPPYERSRLRRDKTH